MASIQTPDQRVRVFISSTMRELAAERAAVRKAVERLHLTPILFELGARPHPPKDLYLAYLRQSHIFLGIYWEQYGWVAPGEQVSGIEDEYVAARDLPKLIYIKSPAPNRQERLTAMLDRIRSDGLSYRSFRTPRELAALVADDLALVLSERFAAPPAVPDDRRTERHLPAPTSPFIGRREELNELRALLVDHGTRLVTLTGPGGVGKTRLATQLLSSIDDDDLEGPWLVELAGLQDPALLANTVASALGVLPRPGQDPIEALAASLGSRPGLLALDNSEHLIDAVATLVSSLLARCPGLRVLTTSREPLRVQGEYVYQLHTLPVTRTRRDGKPADGDAMRLFAARAEEVLPGFVIDDRNRALVRLVSERLDGLPLAIELAAARLPVLSLQQLADRLDDRFALLSRGSRDAEDRQRTLAATIEWSYRLLPPAEQRLFLQLSVFRGGFRLDAVEGVTGRGPAVLDLLSNLVAKSLVSADLDGDSARYRMLESLREYAERRLSAPARRKALRAHLDWYADLARRADTELHGPQAGTWLHRLDAEQDNLRAAMTHAMDSGEHASALEMAGSLSWFWYRRGYVTEGRGWLGRALAATGDEPTVARGVALLGSAGLAYLSGQLADAANLTRRAVAVAEAVGDDRTRARGLIYTAYFSATLGDLATAAESAEAGRAVATSADLADLESEAHAALGQLALAHGDAHRAEELFLQAAAIAHRIGHRWQEGSALWSAAKLALERGDPRLALTRLRTSLDLMTSEEDRTSTLVGLHTMAAVLAACGAPVEGAQLLGAVQLAGERIGFAPDSIDPAGAAAITDRVRTSLPPERFDQAVAEGHRMTLEEAFTFIDRAAARCADAPMLTARSDHGLDAQRRSLLSA